LRVLGVKRGINTSIKNIDNDSILCYHLIVNNKHRKVLKAVFSYPMQGMLEWKEIEALLTAIGAKTIEGRGSRVRFVFGKVVATFHRPHPEKDAKPYQVRDARTFLEAIGVKP